MTRKPMPTAWLILMNSRLSAVSREILLVTRSKCSWRPGRTLGAAADELGSVAHKVLRDIGEFLESLRHGCRDKWETGEEE